MKTKKQYQLILFSLDGGYVIEATKFNSIDEAWEFENNMGSRWFFYPYPYIIEEGGKKIVSSCDYWNFDGQTFQEVAEKIHTLNTKIHF